MTTEGREANPDWVTPHVVHPRLHQDYELDFWMRKVDDIAPTLTSSMLAGIASSIHLIGEASSTQKACIPQNRRGPAGSWKSSCSASSTRPLTCRRACGDRGRQTVGAGGN